MTERREDEEEMRRCNFFAKKENLNEYGRKM